MINLEEIKKFANDFKKEVEISPSWRLAWSADTILQLVNEVERYKLKDVNGCCIVEHGWRISTEHRVEKLTNANKILRDGLVFYSDVGDDVLDWSRVNDSACVQDKGKTARKALAEADEVTSEK